VPLVAALQKTVNMHSQAVFGNAFSTRALLDHLRSEGQWREWAVMSVLHLQWRARDQPGRAHAMHRGAVASARRQPHGRRHIPTGRGGASACGGGAAGRRAQQHVPGLQLADSLSKARERGDA
jgi:hypothetical protein